MYRFVPLLVILSLSLFHCEKVRYDDYSVVRFFGLNTTDILELYDADFDVWAANQISGWTDVMIHKDQISSILKKYPNFEIKFSNVQTHLDEAEARRGNSNPQAFFDTFRTSDEVFEFLDEQIKAHPDITRNIVIGATYEGNIIRGLQIGSNANAPIVYFHCTIHAREWITTPTCCWLIDQLLNVDPDRRDLTTRATWVIVPIFNVDGYDYTWSTARLWRKNRQPNSGSTCWGTDLNRNYGNNFGGPGSSNNPCSETFRGTRAFSGPETNAEQTYLTGLGSNLVAFVDIHSYGALFMSPWCWTDALPVDYTVMNTLMQRSVGGIRSINGISYDYGTSGRTLYLAAGGGKDWTYGDRKVVASFSIEIAGNSFEPGEEVIEPRCKEIYQGVKELVRGIVT